MPSVTKFFVFVGGALWALLSLVNFLLLPSTGATLIVSVPEKSAIAVEHDLRASKVERWRAEPAAITAGPQAGPSANVLLAAKFIAQPDRFVPAPLVEAARPLPAQLVAAVATTPAKLQLAVATISIVGIPTAEEIAAERARKVAGRNAKVAKAKATARRERLARELAASKQYASNQQDQFYYGQQQPVAAAPPSAALRSQPSYGALAGSRTTTAAARPSERVRREVRVAKVKANARQRYASHPQGPSYFGQRGSQQAMPHVSAFAPQPTYGPFSRTW